MQCTYTICFSIMLAEMAEKIHALLLHDAEDVIEDDAPRIQRSLILKLMLFLFLRPLLWMSMVRFLWMN